MRRKFIHWLARSLFRLLSRLCVEGMENVPALGPAIMVSNHLSRLDSPLMFTIIERTDITALVADKYKKNPWISWLVEGVRGIWLNREQADLGALRGALDHLEQGGLLGIAPEGTRSKTGAMMPAKTGAAYLVDRAGVPVIPVAIWGTETAVDSLTHLRRPYLNVRIGRAFDLPPIKRGERSAGLQRNSDEIMCRIAVLLPPGYRGVYADHPRLLELEGRAPREIPDRVASLVA